MNYRQPITLKKRLSQIKQGSIAILELVKYISVRISSEFGVRGSENFVPHLFEKGYKYRLTNNRRLKKIASKRNKKRTFSSLINLQIHLVSCFNLKILSVKISKLIINIFRWIGQVLLAKKNEPCIKQKRDRHGNLYWQVYDFTTNKSYTFGSERKVRAWIEERYNR